MGSGLENICDSIPCEVLVEWARDIRKHEGNVVDQGRGEDGGQSGECMPGGDSEAGDGAISEDKNGSDGVGVLLDLSCNVLLPEFVFPNIASVRQPGGIEDADLRSGNGYSYPPRTLENIGTYHYTVVAGNFVKASRIGLG